MCASSVLVFLPGAHVLLYWHVARLVRLAIDSSKSAMGLRASWSRAHAHCTQKGPTLSPVRSTRQETSDDRLLSEGYVSLTASSSLLFLLSVVGHCFEHDVFLDTDFTIAFAMRF